MWQALHAELLLSVVDLYHDAVRKLPACWLELCRAALERCADGWRSLQVELASAEAQLRSQQEDRAAMELRLQSLEQQVSTAVRIGLDRVRSQGVSPRPVHGTFMCMPVMHHAHCMDESLQNFSLTARRCSIAASAPFSVHFMNVVLLSSATTRLMSLVPDIAE